MTYVIESDGHYDVVLNKGVGVVFGEEMAVVNRQLAAHDALVAACEEAERLSYMNEHLAGFDDQWRKTTSAVNEALRLARGGDA